MTALPMYSFELVFMSTLYLESFKEQTRKMQVPKLYGL